MTRKTFWITLIVGGVLLVPPPVMAHHAVQGQFDFQKPLELSGVLTKMEWINPHAQMHLEVTNKNGTKTNWSFETINPTKLREKGLGRASKGGFEVGKTYVANGDSAWNGGPYAFLKSIRMPDGRTITLWFGDPNGN